MQGVRDFFVARFSWLFFVVFGVDFGLQIRFKPLRGIGLLERSGVHVGGDTKVYLGFIKFAQKNFNNYTIVKVFLIKYLKNLQMKTIQYSFQGNAVWIIIFVRKKV